MLKRLLLVVVVFMVIAVSAGMAAARHLKHWWGNPAIVAAPTIVILARGEDLRSFAAELEKLGLIDSAPRFLVWTRLTQDYRKFQAGTYRFEGEVAPQQIASAVILGEVYHPVVFELTVPEGFSLKKIAARLSEFGIKDAARTELLVSDNELLELIRSHLPKPDRLRVKSIEGFLFPATYPFEVVPTPKDILRRMILTFFEKLPQSYSEKCAALGTNLYDAVIIASLIETETKVREERPVVAEVIWNRLKKGMVLGIDAAIIYGIPHFDGDITFAHLRDGANPYNLRIHGGLPPTPISSPGLESLAAVLTPTSNGYLFYALDPTLAPHHHFSKSMQEHAAAVMRLRKAGL